MFPLSRFGTTARQTTRRAWRGRQVTDRPLGALCAADADFRSRLQLLWKLVLPWGILRTMLAPDNGPEASSLELSATIRIVLADDHAVVRHGLRLLLDSESGFEVVAEAGDVDGARRYVRGHHPAVLVLDLNMHGDSSLEAIPVIRGESPDTQIVV